LQLKSPVIRDVTLFLQEYFFDVSKECCAYIFWVNQSKNYLSLKIKALLAFEQHSSTSQKPQISNGNQFFSENVICKCNN
jgi:hypothetical protein